MSEMMAPGRPDRIDVLRRLSFGHRVAEEELKELTKYFVETEQWRRIHSGDVDIVYGPKGSGKSALYALLLATTDDFFDCGTVLISVDDPRLTPDLILVVDN
jgi:ABC-type multidrug transport system fused ATPase/permease subunit